MKEEKINHYSIVLLFITAFLLAITAYWLLYPEKVITINNSENVQVDKKVYHAGDRISYVLDYCKYKPYSAAIYRTLVNSFRINYTEMHSSLPVGCRVLNVNDLVIPDFVGDGIYHLEVAIEYRVNPLRTEKTSWRSVAFEVIGIKTMPDGLPDQVETNTDDIKENTKDIEKLQ